MLFVMGLIVIVGTTASWKARTVSNARQAAWRSLWPRTGAIDPYPAGWPSNGHLRVESSPNNALPSDPFASHPVVRGQPLAAPSGEIIPVRTSLLSISGNLQLGVAELDRPYPLLGNMDPGRIHLMREHAVLDRVWGFHEMVGSNNSRRIPALYPIDMSGPLAGELTRFGRAANQIVSNPQQRFLQMLDDDSELRNPRAPVGSPSYEPPYGIGRAPDYHFPEGVPRTALLNPDSVCSYDLMTLEQRVRNPLLSEVLLVPRRLTRDYLAMYRRHQAHIKSITDRLDGITQPPFQPLIAAELNSKRGQMNANNALLTEYIAQLTAFESSL